MTRERTSRAVAQQQTEARRATRTFARVNHHGENMMRAQHGARVLVAVATVVVATIAVACGRSSDGGSVSSKVLRAAMAVDAASTQRDPCTFLAANEAAPYVGTLSTPPYRSDGDRPATDGDQCVYRGTGAREVVIKMSPHGARVGGSVLTDVPKMLGAVLGKGAPGLDSMANRVMEQAPDGPWDKATWIPGGSLFVTKGDVMVVVDVSGSSGQKSDAIAMGKLIAPRIGHPLSYDGAKAVALAPKPAERPANACAFLSRSVVEAAIGTLSGDPQPDADGAGCTYTVKSDAGVRTYPVEFTWEGGQRGYNMLKNSMSMVTGMIGSPKGANLDSIPVGGQAGALIGGLMKMVSGGNGSTATGAVAKVGFKTDTALVGPWDAASLLHGTQLIAVRRDVLVGMSLTSADYDRAKALLAAICERL